MPRCGTNFLLDILSCHPDAIPSPNDIWEFHHFLNVDWLHEYLRRLAKSKHMSRLNLNAIKRHFGDAWLSYMREHAGDAEGRFVLKEPWVRNLEYFFEYFPEALLVLIVRNGRDAVASAVQSGFLTDESARALSFEATCAVWNESALKTAELVRLTFKKRQGQVLLVRYEDLFRRQPDETRRILKFCRLSLSRYDWRAAAALPVRGSSFQRDAHGDIEFTMGAPRDEAFRPVSRSDSWTEEQRVVFARCCEAGMKALDYA